MKIGSWVSLGAGLGSSVLVYWSSLELKRGHAMPIICTLTFFIVFFVLIYCGILNEILMGFGYDIRVNEIQILVNSNEIRCILSSNSFDNIDRCEAKFRDFFTPASLPVPPQLLQVPPRQSVPITSMHHRYVAPRELDLFSSSSQGRSDPKGTGQGRPIRRKAAHAAFELREDRRSPSGKELIQLNLPSLGVQDGSRFAFSPDGSLVAFMDMDGTLLVLNGNDYSQVYSLETGFMADRLTFSKDGQTLILDGKFKQETRNMSDGSLIRVIDVSEAR